MGHGGAKNVLLKLLGDSNIFLPLSEFFISYIFWANVNSTNHGGRRVFWKWRGSETVILFLKIFPTWEDPYLLPIIPAFTKFSVLLLTDGVLIKKVIHIHLLWT